MKGLGYFNSNSVSTFKSTKRKMDFLTQNPTHLLNINKLFTYKQILIKKHNTCKSIADYPIIFKLGIKDSV